MVKRLLAELASVPKNKLLLAPRAPLVTTTSLPVPGELTKRMLELLHSVEAPSTHTRPVPTELPTATFPPRFVMKIVPPGIRHSAVWPAVVPMVKLAGETMVELLSVVSVPWLKLKIELVNPAPLL